MDISGSPMFVPVWLNLAEYPYRFHEFEGPRGSMHYIDEGRGNPIVFVHGWLSWSFLYRNVIKELLLERRCLAVDLLGFGLADKPSSAAYGLLEQKKRLLDWLEDLQLQQLTLVAADIHSLLALEVAQALPQIVDQLVLINPIWSTDQFRQTFRPLFGIAYSVYVQHVTYAVYYSQGDGFYHNFPIGYTTIT